MTPPHLQRILNHSTKNYWLVCNQLFLIALFTKLRINHICISSLVKVIDSKTVRYILAHPVNCCKFGKNILHETIQDTPK